MAGIYIHIPFCTRKCHYCNFFSQSSQKLKIPFVTAIKQEIALTREYLSNHPIQTIYFGGGTPSLFHPMILQEIMAMALHTTCQVHHYQDDIKIHPPTSKEFTLEINPDNVSDEYVAELRQTDFNRFSIGVQSFFDQDLKFLNRTHTAFQAFDAVTRLQKAGFDNVSIDLIYGIPGSTTSRWEKNLDIAFSLGVPHISAYALTIEPKTSLAWMIAKQRVAPLNEEEQIEQFKILIKKTKDAGFLQYEISNFCLPNHYSRHNTNYWNGVSYLGLGPSAHSFNGYSRRWNLSNLSTYIECIGKRNLTFEEEFLSPEQHYNEYVMTSLRTMWGCDSQKIRVDFGSAIFDLFKKNALPLIDQGLLKEVSGVYFLTEDGKLFADRIASDLFVVSGC
ncbi:MAG: radical SAM family heme chaperone HemW [Bacteroidales bacterium]|nr:radical SAM family heme chaperone HemW [Bacteroidales bacterium]